MRGGCAGAFTRWVFFRPQGTGDGLSLSRRKQKPRAGAHPETTACVRDAGKKETRSATCSPQVWAFSPPGKTEAVRGHALGTSRVRARLGKATNPVRELLTAGVGFLPARENRSSAWARTRKQPRACETRGRKRHGARLAHRRCGLSPRPGKQKPCVGTHPETTACVRDTGKKETRSATCSAQPRGEEADRANRFAGGRRTTGCTAGDEAACADSPAPGRRVRELLTAGAAGSPCIRAGEYGMLRARQNRQSSRNSLRGRADAPVPWKGPGDICARPCVCR